MRGKRRGVGGRIHILAGSVSVDDVGFKLLYVRIDVDMTAGIVLDKPVEGLVPSRIGGS